MATHPAARRSTPVLHDWIAPLAAAQHKSYHDTVRQLETAYTMWSVNLDEAMSLRKNGRNAKASLALGISPALCERLSHPLLASLRAMLFHARHFGTTPNFAPLSSENFQLCRTERAARLNSVFSKLFLTKKSQFQYKLGMLLELVYDLTGSFISVSAELNDSSAAGQARNWDLLDATHYDINTCLRETIVLLKSFLLVVPDAQFEDFNSSLQRELTSTFLHPTPGLPHLAHRRLAILKGQ